MAVARPLDRLLDPLDAARRFVFGEVSRVDVARRVLARRDARLLLQSSFGVSVAFALTLLFPGALYVLGPAIFGVPHIASELRYLVLRRSTPRPWIGAVLVGSALLVAVRVAQMLAPDLAALGRAEVGLGWGLGLVGAVVGGLVAGTPRRAAWLVPPLALAFGASLAEPSLARLAFAHAHNVITIALWVWLFRRRPAFAIPALALIACGAVFFASGVGVGVARFDGSWAERVVSDAITGMPRWVPQRTSLGLGLAFVFLQSIHYAVWLAWIPQEDVRVEGTLSFRMSARSIARDLGGLGVALVVATGALVVAASALDVHRTRALYLSLATFHGYVEVAMLAFLVARGRLPRGETA